jgi:hypothetical protein
MAVLVFIGLVFGTSLQLAKRWGQHRIEEFGSRVGARSLFYGWVVFIAAGALYAVGLGKVVPVDFGNLLVLLFMVVVIIPVIVKTWSDVRLMPITGL